MNRDEVRADATTQAPGPPAGLFPSLVASAELAQTQDKLPAAREFTGELATRLGAWLNKQGGVGTVPLRPQAVLNELLGEVDELLSDQVNEVIHHKDFQSLEATWRGLYYLVSKTPPDNLIKFQLLDVTKEELLDDFQSNTNEIYSTLFAKVHEEEYGMYGGQPFGLLVGDFEFSHDTRDVALLTSVSKVAAAAHAPFIAAVSPQMFKWKDFTQLQYKTGLSDIFDPDSDPSYAPWKSFRESEESRYVGLCMPHMLLREPYRPPEKGREGLFKFEEQVTTEQGDSEAVDHSKFLWGNAAYALATRMTEAFFNYRWCVSIRGPRGGGLVTGLPTYTFLTDEGDVAQTCPTEIAITQSREYELSELGFITLVHCKNTDKAAFFATPTCQEPKLWNTEEANANSALSARLQYIMATSRIAHYLKVMMLNYVGDYTSREDCENYLHRWIRQYVTTASKPSLADMRETPLSDAQVEVEDNPDRPGYYRAVAYLRPHYQLESLNVSLRLVAELPKPKT